MGVLRAARQQQRRLAIWTAGALDAWLSARPEQAREFMRAYPANWLLANPVEKKELISAASIFNSTWCPAPVCGGEVMPDTCSSGVAAP